MGPAVNPAAHKQLLRCRVTAMPTLLAGQIKHGDDADLPPTPAGAEIY